MLQSYVRSNGQDADLYKTVLFSSSKPNQPVLHGACFFSFLSSPKANVNTYNGSDGFEDTCTYWRVGAVFVVVLT